MRCNWRVRIRFFHPAEMEIIIIETEENFSFIVLRSHGQLGVHWHRCAAPTDTHDRSLRAQLIHINVVFFFSFHFLLSLYWSFCGVFYCLRSRRCNAALLFKCSVTCIRFVGSSEFSFFQFLSHIFFFLRLLLCVHLLFIVFVFLTNGERLNWSTWSSETKPRKEKVHRTNGKRNRI